MNKRKNKHNNNKKNNTNLNQKDNNSYKKFRPRTYPTGFLFYLIESTIKDIYYIFSLIILKIYYNCKIEVLSHQDYFLFFVIETIINGGSFYYLIYSLVKFYDLHSPLNQEWSYIYIWIICSIQLLFFFTSIILFLLKYIYIKLFFISKFKILFKILCIVIIIFNILSLNDLNNDKYSFQIQNFEMKKLEKYKPYFIRNYVNLYLSKDYDVNEYELCFDMKYPKNFSDILKKEPPYFLWKFEKKKDYFIGCRNISFKDNPAIDKNNPLSFFKCDLTNNINILPNYCIPAEKRRKKYSYIFKLNIFEFVLLISFFLYGKFCNYIFRKYFYINLLKENSDDTEEKNEEGEENEEENEVEGEEEEDEGEEEEDDEEEQEDQEEVEENNNWRKHRKISKKKMKYYKKKQKNRFRKYNYNNNNQNIDKKNEEENDNDEDKNEEDKNEKYKNENNNKKENENENEIKDNNKELNNKKNETDNDNDNNNKENKDDNNKNNEKNKNKENKENKENNGENNDNKNKDEENEEDNCLSQPYKRNSFLYQLILGGIVDKIKNKFYNILKEIDEDIRENEKD